MPAGQFRAFDQAEFAAGDAKPAGLAERGYLYMPPACASSPGCRVHIALHGCSQNAQAVGERFVREAGLAEWADTNRLIVLYPQTRASVGNPQACWDWWGYSGRDYLTRAAPQIQAISAMLDRLESPKSP